MKKFPACLLFILILVGCSRTYLLPVEVGDSFRDEVAIRISKAALEMDGVDVTNFEPASFRAGSSGVLAKAADGTERGYVIWRRTGEVGYAYSVSIEPQGGNWMCNVGSAK